MIFSTFFFFSSYFKGVNGIVDDKLHKEEIRFVLLEEANFSAKCIIGSRND